MRKIKSVLSLLLVMAYALSVLPFMSFAQSSLTYEYMQTGNTGAVIKLTSGTLKSVENKSENLVNVSVSENTVTVSAVAAVTGVAKIVLSDTSSNTQIVEIPIGYTTFILNGDELSVYEGSDTKYDITGINISGEEYSEEVTDEAYLLTYTQNSDGSKTYTNTDNYSLSINIGKKGGTYAFSGSSDDMAISVKKEATGAAVLLLASLDLTSKFTSPFTIKKNSTTTVKLSALAGSENTLTDATLNNADTYGDTADGGNGTNASFAESAVIKGKTAANLTLSGSGILNLVCNSKNAIKVAQSGKLTIENLTLNVTSITHGISVDNVLTVNSGTINVTAEGDAIRSNPDSVDADTGYAGNIVIGGGNFTIQAGSDGIQAAQDITITDGTFHITTLSGYNSSSFNSDTMSCKGIKASASEDVEEATNTITISGGTFYLNTADDAIHSDAYITISAGTFEIYTGDDGMHADTSLTLGVENGLERDVQVTIKASYEGLEAGNVYIYSGKYYVIASDDGINAAGGSSNGSDPGAGGGNQFNPGGGPGGNQGGPGGNQGGPGGNQGGDTSSSGDYAINIYGGDIYINVEGDGIDSNGNINIYGGNIEVWGMKSGGDNEPIDHDGNLVIQNATVFAGGTKGMEYVHSGISSTNQSYKYSTTSYTSGRVIYIKNASGTVVYKATAPKSINYVFYTSPSVTSSYSVATSGSATCSAANAWGHTWNSGVVTTEATESSDGIMTFTCTVCGATERQTIHYSTSESEESVYTASFVTDSYCTVDVYYTQDYTTADETSVSTAYARNSTTGEIDTTGAGQINFTVNCADGYEVDTVDVYGSYKNLKGPADTAVKNAYRITKVTGDLSIVITCKEAAEEVIPFTATFTTDENCTVDIYYTQDYTTADETSVSTAYARNSTTGEIDTTGAGQINFIVNCAEGYAVDCISIEGSYKNLKGSEETGVENAYRITKVAGDLSITINLKHVYSFTYTAQNLASKTVTMTIKNGETTYTATSDTGVFLFENIEQGEYNLYFSAEKCVTVSAGTVSIGESAESEVTNNELYLPIGDVNGDGSIDINDIALLLQADVFATENDTYDINDDGIADMADLSVILMDTNYGKSSVSIV